MRARLALLALLLIAHSAVSCGDEPAATTRPPPRSTPTTTAVPLSSTSSASASTSSTTSASPSPSSPSVVWRETLALGSNVSVRHLAVSNGLFLALTETDFRRPGEVPLAAYLSTNGANWTRVDLPVELFADVIIFEFAGGASGFVGIGAEIAEAGRSAHRYAWTSADGESWNRSELIDPDVPQATSPFVVTVTDPSGVAVGPNGFVVAGATTRFLDTGAIIDAYQPDFEWPEFASMATRVLSDGDVELTIGGAGDDFVATFSELGIEPADFPVGDLGSDWITVPLGSHVWTSQNGVDWVAQPGPELPPRQPMGVDLAIDATTFGLLAHAIDRATGQRQTWRSADGGNWGSVAVPGSPVREWEGGLYAVDDQGRLWLSAEGRAWAEAMGPKAVSNSRQLVPVAATPRSGIALGGIRPDAQWISETVPETWFAYSPDGELWWEATGVDAFGMAVWPEAMAVDRDRIVIGLVGPADSAHLESRMWLGTAVR